MVQTLATDIFLVFLSGGSARAVLGSISESVAGKKFRHEVSASSEEDSLAVAHGVSLVEVMKSCMMFECKVKIQ